MEPYYYCICAIHAHKVNLIFQQISSPALLAIPQPDLAFILRQLHSREPPMMHTQLRSIKAERLIEQLLDYHLRGYLTLFDYFENGSTFELREH